MSYDAKVFNVMIASPSDVASERSIIRDVIYEWNAVHSQLRNIVLLPLGWESHASPEMGDSAQSIINHQVLDKCDMLVGVFWTRLGTPTNDFPSGTVEEIEKQVEAGKPVMLYFSSQPVVMDTVDLNQFSELKKFKESCKKRGLFESYDSHSDFKEKFYRHLQLKLNEHDYFKNNILDFENSLVESKVKLPKLSSQARIILKKASLDSHGQILNFRDSSGVTIQTNGKNLIPSQQNREVVKWTSALNELLNEELIKGIGYKGEIFEITNLGYQIADMIEM